LWLLRGRTTPVVPFAIMIMALGRRLALKNQLPVLDAAIRPVSSCTALPSEPP